MHYENFCGSCLSHTVPAHEDMCLCQPQRTVTIELKMVHLFKTVKPTTNNLYLGSEFKFQCELKTQTR